IATQRLTNPNALPAQHSCDRLDVRRIRSDESIRLVVRQISYALVRYLLAARQLWRVETFLVGDVIDCRTKSGPKPLHCLRRKSAAATPLERGPCVGCLCNRMIAHHAVDLVEAPQVV